MDLDYFKSHIKEELEGAKDYIKRAIEIKPMDPNWAKMFVEMSTAELNHANYLYTMFIQYVDILDKSFPNTPDYIFECKNKVTDIYTEMSAKVKMMHEMYK